MKTALFLLATLVAPGVGQEIYAQGRDVFKVDFTIRDTGDAGGKSGRKYSLLVYGGNKGVFKIGNRVPVPSGPAGGSNTQFTYVDVGVNIDCTVQEVMGKVSLRADMDLSTAVTNEKAPGPAPTISQIRFNIEASIPAGKPAIVASFDDPVTSRKFEVEAMATKVN
jgi:hypothetical protein